jgi:hypothetical protein
VIAHWHVSLTPFGTVKYHCYVLCSRNCANAPPPLRPSIQHWPGHVLFHDLQAGHRRLSFRRRLWAHFVLTILPCLDPICPYHTPLSSISWYPWHAFASFAEFFIRGILKCLHTLLVRVIQETKSQGLGYKPSSQSGCNLSKIPLIGIGSD